MGNEKTPAQVSWQGVLNGAFHQCGNFIVSHVARLLSFRPTTLEGIIGGWPVKVNRQFGYAGWSNVRQMPRQAPEQAREMRGIKGEALLRAGSLK